MADDRTLLENLEYVAKRAEQGVEAARKELTKQVDRLSHARALLDFERVRIGKLAPAQNGRYSGLPLRDSIIQILKDEAGRYITREAIIDRLLRNGVAFTTKTPGRSIHAALIVVEEVEKIEGRYRWRAGTGHMDDLRSMKSEPLG